MKNHRILKNWLVTIGVVSTLLVQCLPNFVSLVLLSSCTAMFLYEFLIFTMPFDNASLEVIRLLENRFYMIINMT